MIIKYDNNLYRYLDRKNHIEILTENIKKINDTFYDDDGVYVKEIQANDPNIQDVYEVDFYLTYLDTSETNKQHITKWNVNERKPLYRNPCLEDDEVGLSLQHDSWSPDWIQDDKYSCSKIVKLSECSDFTVTFTYIIKNGKKLDQKLVQETKVTMEDFKSEMIRYRPRNI